MEKVLEAKKDKDKKVPIPDLDLQKFIHYDIKIGACVLMEQAFGLPGKCFRMKLYFTIKTSFFNICAQCSFTASMGATAGWASHFPAFLFQQTFLCPGV